MAVALDRPDQLDDLYLERGSPVPPWRPVMQGDVFEDVTVPNAREHEGAMVVSHPCTMRSGAQLKPLVQAAPVTRYQAVESAQWATGFFRVFPLPELFPLVPGASHAVLLDQAGLVRTDDLDLDKRVACLSEQGILLLQQRFVFCLTRAVIRLKTLDAASRSVLEEVELLEQWNESLAAARCDAGGDRENALSDEALAFDAFLSEPEGNSLRDTLETPPGRAEVRRAIRQEIAARHSAEG